MRRPASPAGAMRRREEGKQALGGIEQSRGETRRDEMIHDGKAFVSWKVDCSVRQNYGSLGIEVR